MEKFRKWICVALALLLLCLAGCGQQDEWAKSLEAIERIGGITDDALLREDAEKMLNALIADDATGAYAVMYAGTDFSQFLEAYEQMRLELGDLQTYRLIPSGIHKTVTNGEGAVSIRYMMEAGEQRFYVDVTREEAYDGLTGFYITKYVPVITNGTLSNMEGANVAQWVFLILGMLELAFVVWAFVDCCRHKVRRKWLWLLLIALGYAVSQMIFTPEQFRVGTRLGLFLSYTCLMRYSTGGFTLQFLIPAGAIVYVVLRKRLFANYLKFQQEKLLKAQKTETIPEETAHVEETTER